MPQYGWRSGAPPTPRNNDPNWHQSLSQYNAAMERYQNESALHSQTQAQRDLMATQNMYQRAAEGRRWGRLQQMMQQMGLSGGGGGGSAGGDANAGAAEREAFAGASGAARAGGRERAAALKRNLVRSGINTSDPAQALMAETAEAGTLAETEQGIAQGALDLESRIEDRKFQERSLAESRRLAMFQSLMSMLN